MTKYRESNAALNSKTYDRNKLEAPTENIYEALAIIAKRSIQINLDIKKELHALSSRRVQTVQSLSRH